MEEVQNLFTVVQPTQLAYSALPTLTAQIKALILEMLQRLKMVPSPCGCAYKDTSNHIHLILSSPVTNA